MEDDVLAVVRERGEASFTDVNAAVDGDTGAVFRCCRDLERRGDIHAVRPLVYRPGAEPAGDGATDAAPGDSHGDAAGEGDDAGTVDGAAETAGADRAAGAEGFGGVVETDDGGFEWVG